jgi:outer membrane protein assembly factor BamB
MTPNCDDGPQACHRRHEARRPGSRSQLITDGLRIARVTLLAATSLLAAASGASIAGLTTASAMAAQPASSVTSSTSWSFPGADLQNTRDVGGPINASNVSRLAVAWTDPINAFSAFGAYATTPVVSGGVMYTQDLQSNVEAINLQSGKVLWTKRYNALSAGPNGVVVANGTVFGATPTSAFALSASTGQQIWIKKLTRNFVEGIDMAPGYDNGTVYVSTVPLNVPNLYLGNGQGILWALNGSTGATRWKWDTVPTNLWSTAHTDINSGGGLWNPPTFDGHGNMYMGVANPGPIPGTPQYPWGSSRPGPNLYTDSIVKLNAKTGRLLWYYQLTPHDLYDRDLQNSPILANARGRQIVIDGGKAGILVAVNARTGKLVWRRSVGVHNGHDNDNLLAEHGETSKLHVPEVIEPGDLGGIESPLASTGTTVFAAVNNLPSKYTGQGFAYLSFPIPFAKGTGELVAVNEATGKIEWDHKLPSSPYGGATVANNVVFTTTYNGTLYAFNVSTGAEIWHTKLPSNTNAEVAVVGNALLTAASYANAAGSATIVAYRLGAMG